MNIEIALLLVAALIGVWWAETQVKPLLRDWWEHREWRNWDDVSP